jgi:hypothetical protein
MWSDKINDVVIWAEWMTSLPMGWLVRSAASLLKVWQGEL